MICGLCPEENQPGKATCSSSGGFNFDQASFLLSQQFPPFQSASSHGRFCFWLCLRQVFAQCPWCRISKGSENSWSQLSSEFSLPSLPARLLCMLPSALFILSCDLPHPIWMSGCCDYSTRVEAVHARIDRGLVSLWCFVDPFQEWGDGTLWIILKGLKGEEFFFLGLFYLVWMFCLYT